MYKSAITLYAQNMETQQRQQQEQTVWECVNALGVVVDKEELFKALKYDRDQYNKGYKDGVNEVLGKIRAKIEEGAKIVQHVNIEKAKALCWCLDVIDKYTEESEGNE